MESSKAVQAIENKLSALSQLSETRQFNVWQKETVLTLINIYSENDKRIKSFEAIHSYQNFGLTGIDRFPQAKLEAESLLKSLVTDINDFGLQKSETKDKKGDINVNVNQHNHQNQSTTITIQFDFLFELLKDELKGGQVKELKAIIESDEPAEEKKKSFIEKIKSFGNDVASSILANLLTNPQIYEHLGKMI